VRQELLAKQAELRKLVIRQRLKNQEALKRSNQAIVDLFESKGLTGKTSLANLLRLITTGMLRSGLIIAVGNYLLI